MGNGCMSNKRVQVEDTSSLSFKVVVVGNSKCGKSSLIQRFIHNEYNEEYNETISVDILSVVKKVNVPNHAVVSLELWDIPGHDNIDLRKTYYRDVDAVIVVVDLSEENTLELAASWKLDVLNHAKVTRHFTETVVTDDNKSTKAVQRKEYLPPKPGSIPILLLGNKYDLAKEKYLLEVENETGITLDDGTPEPVPDEKENKEVESEEIREDVDEVEKEDDKKVNEDEEHVKNEEETSSDDKTVKTEEGEGQEDAEATVTPPVEEEHKEEETQDEQKPAVQDDAEDAAAGNEADLDGTTHNENVPNGEMIIANGHTPKENGDHPHANGHVKMKKIFPKDLKHQQNGNVHSQELSTETTEKQSPVDFDDSNVDEANILPACVEDLESIADKHGFIAGIPVSAKTSNGGVHEAVQSLLRHLVVRKTFEIESSRKNNAKKIPHADATSVRTARSVVSKSSSTFRQTYDASFEPLQEVGMIEIDDVITSCNPSLQHAEDIMTGFFTSVHRFKQMCKKCGFVRSSRCSLEECITTFKLAVAITVSSGSNDVIMKIKTEDEILKNPYYVLISEKADGFLSLQIVDRNHDNVEMVANAVSGEMEVNSDFSDEIMDVLKEYRTEFQEKSGELLKSGSELENILSHNSKKLATKEDKAWELAVSAGLSHTEVRRMLLTIAQNKARVRGTLENLREANKTAENYERKIRASLLL